MAEIAGRDMKLRRGSQTTTGTAQAGAAGTITLDAGASATDDIYNGSLVYISAGPGAGQWRRITDYVGTTKVATIAPNWTVQPTNASTYIVYAIPDVVAGVRSKGVTINKEPIDVTTDDDEGWRKLLNKPATKSVDISVEGVTKDDSLRETIMTGESAVLAVLAVEYSDGSFLIGDFHLVSVEETGEYEDAVTFSGSLQSSGAVVFVPAP